MKYRAETATAHTKLSLPVDGPPLASQAMPELPLWGGSDDEDDLAIEPSLRRVASPRRVCAATCFRHHYLGWRGCAHTASHAAT